MLGERRVRLAILNDHELVVRGLAAMMARFRDRIEIVDVEAGRQVDTPVDVVLFDTFAPRAPTPRLVAEMRRNPLIGHIAVYTLRLDEGLVRAAKAAGADGYLYKGLSGEDLVTAILRINAGERIYVGLPSPRPVAASRTWPGREQGLTEREAEVMSLITRGLTNVDIAERLHLSPNSIKSHIRSAYRKIGATRRSQAVRWGFENGFSPAEASTS